MKGHIGLDQKLLQAVRRLRVLSAPAGGGALEGARVSGRSGPGIEFADWRPYSEGDPIRELDWRALARWGRPLVRLRAREEASTVCILLDSSQSMTFGKPPKFVFAGHIAAAIAAAALAGLDAVLVGFLRGPDCELAEAVTGEDALPDVLRLMERAEPAGPTDLTKALHSFLERTARLNGGALLVLSDFWTGGDLGEALALAAERGFQGALIQVLEFQELAPTLGGRVRLVDSETGEELELEISRAVREAYLRERKRFFEQLTETASRWGFRTALLHTGLPLEQAVLGELRSAGILG